MAFNQVAKYVQGYVTTVGNVGGVIAGVAGLLLKGSTDLAGACVDPSGNIYVTDASKHIVLKITQGGVITVIAGLSGTSGNNTDVTVTAANARFNYPTGIICDKNGDLYVCDTNNHQIRKISNNKVSLVAGAATPTSGTADGVGHAARFNKPYDIAQDPSGVLYVADTDNHAIRKIVGGVVSTIAGAKGTPGNAPTWAQMTTAAGVLGTTARFRYPYAVAVDPRGYVFVSDTDNHVIKRIDPAGRVRIFSGSGVYGTNIGTAKTSTYQDLKFSDINKSAELFIVDYNETGPSRLLRINEDGVPGVVINFTVATSGQYLAAVACTPSSKLIIIQSEYTKLEYSSSSSSSIDSSSSSSLSSESSSSSSLSSSSSSIDSSSSSSSSISSESSSSSIDSSSSSSSISSESSSSSSLQYSSESSSSSSLSSESSSSSSISSESSSSSSLSSESSSSSSSSSLSSESSSSSSSLSSESSSSSSLSSESSSSSSSLSSESSSSSSLSSESSSSSSLSSESSSSSSLSSESSSSSSSSSLYGCSDLYCASTFTTAALNGTWTWTGGVYNSKPIYRNVAGTYLMWYDDTGYWAISNDVGDPENQWLSSTDNPVSCPDGDIWVFESGLVVEGECSSSSSSSSSFDSSSSSSSLSSESSSSSSSSSLSSESSSSSSSSSLSSESSSSSSLSSESSSSSSSLSSESSSSSSSSSLSSESSSSSSLSSESSSSSSSQPIEVLDPGDTLTVPVSETRPIGVRFTGEPGETATVVLNPDDPVTPTQYLYIVKNVAGSFVWDFGGLDEHTFTVIGETYIQNAGGILYTIKYDGLGSLLFTVEFDQFLSSSSSSIDSSSSSSSYGDEVYGMYFGDGEVFS